MGISVCRHDFPILIAQTISSDFVQRNDRRGPFISRLTLPHPLTSCFCLPQMRRGLHRVSLRAQGCLQRYCILFLRVQCWLRLVLLLISVCTGMASYSAVLFTVNGSNSVQTFCFYRAFGGVLFYHFCFSLNFFFLYNIERLYIPIIYRDV